MFKEYYQKVEREYARCILGANSMSSIIPRAMEGKWQDLHSRSLEDYAMPEDLTEFLEECRLLSSETKEHIEDYRYFISFRKQRRPEVWAKRREW